MEPGDALDVPRFREQRRGTALRPYEVLTGTDRPGRQARRMAEAILERGWERQPFPPVRLDPPVDWDNLGATNRSWQFHLHSWDALSPVLAAYRDGGEARYLQFASAVALDWIASYPSRQSESAFAWYDMAIGMRAYRLGYILDVMSRDTRYPDDAVALLLQSALAHLDAFSDDSLFAAHSNHGFYFAAGEAALARRFPELPGMATAIERADQRLRQLIERQFTAEGVHREHSPDYHRMVLETFEGLLAADLLSSELESVIASVQEALGWFVMPNRRLVMFGDTPHRFMGPAGWQGRHPALAYAVTGGKEGTPPSERMRYFEASGYVIFREAWGDGPDDVEDWGYLAQTGAFHSRTHKHADDLSFVWYDHGCELLVDAGRYGYLEKTKPGSPLWLDGFWYGDPKRVYAESTRAHNTVQVDGRNLPRRGVEPYGSAFRGAGEQQGVFWSLAEVNHASAVRQRRVLLYRPRAWLAVVDWVWDDEGETHDVVQRFHFAPEVGHVPGTLTFRLPAEDALLHMTDLAGGEILPVVRGREDPLLGWISREDGVLEPTSTTGVAFRDIGSARFATLFTFGDSAPEALPLEADRDAMRLSWRQDAAVHRVGLRLVDDAAAVDLDWTIEQQHG